MRQLKGIKIKNYENMFNLWRIPGTKLVLLVDFWDHIFRTVFPKFFFLLKTPKCLEKFVNCVTKCLTAKIYPMKVWIVQFFFKSLYVQLKIFFNKSEITIPEQFFLNTFFVFSTLNSRMSKNMCIWRPKWASVQLLHGQMNLDVLNSASTN